MMEGGTPLRLSWLNLRLLFRSEPRWDFANTVAAVVLLRVGARVARRKPKSTIAASAKDIYFALFCLLYAIKLLASLPLICNFRIADDPEAAATRLVLPAPSDT